MKPAKGINWKAERVKGNCRGRESATRIGRDEVDDACNGDRDGRRKEGKRRERQRGKSAQRWKQASQKKKVVFVLGWKLRRQGTDGGSITTETPHGRSVIKMAIAFPLMLFTEFAPPANDELKC